MKEVLKKRILLIEEEHFKAYSNTLFHISPKGISRIKSLMWLNKKKNFLLPGN